jgi:hypothetical protein
LKKIGIKIINEYNNKDQCFPNCEISHEDIEKLYKYAGRFGWFLEPVH